jgi:hypothetical protein
MAARHSIDRLSQSSKSVPDLRKTMQFISNKACNQAAVIGKSPHLISEPADNDKVYFQVLFVVC